jgi:hypothetical protein
MPQLPPVPPPKKKRVGGAQPLFTNCTSRSCGRSLLCAREVLWGSLTPHHASWGNLQESHRDLLWVVGLGSLAIVWSLCAPSWMLPIVSTTRKILFYTVVFLLVVVLGGAARSGSDQRDVGSVLHAALGLCRDGPVPVPSEGAFSRLSHGDTYYVIEGRENGGALVVLVHGFLGSSSYLRYLAVELARRGRRVLRFDLMGRGRTSFIGTPQTECALAGQLAELLFTLVGEGVGAEDPIDLLGYSMGVRAIAATSLGRPMPSPFPSLSLPSHVFSLPL